MKVGWWVVGKAAKKVAMKVLLSVGMKGVSWVAMRAALSVAWKAD